MAYTILGAAYANADNTAAVVRTVEAGAVLAGLVDTPDLWQQMLAQCTPSAYVPGDWRPAAMADLNVLREKLLRILSSMQVDYFMQGQTAYADTCMNAKAQLQVIESASGVQAAYLASPGTRAAFDTAVKAQWLSIVAPAPSQVRADFIKYGGNTT